jgi:cell wall-associated NlpC family hydrolase
MIGDMQRQLDATRKKMLPRARALAYEGAQLQKAKERAHDAQTKADVDENMKDLRQELALALGKADGEADDYYDLYARLSKQLGTSAAPPPKAEPERAAEPPPPVTARPQRPNELAPVTLAPPPGEHPAPVGGLCPVYVGWERRYDVSIDGWIGTPYDFGGDDRGGIDCSAFARRVFRETFSIELPRVSADQYRMGVPIDMKQLKKGDLVFFDTLSKGRITHVAVFDGEGIVANATSSKGVRREKLTDRWLAQAYRGCRRLLLDR